MIALKTQLKVWLLRGVIAYLMQDSVGFVQKLTDTVLLSDQEIKTYTLTLLTLMVEELNFILFVRLIVLSQTNLIMRLCSDPF